MSESFIRCQYQHDEQHYHAFSFHCSWSILVMRSPGAHIGRRTLPAVTRLQMRREMHAKHRHPGYQQRLRGPRPKARAQNVGRISSRHLGPCRLGSVQP